MKKLLSLAFLFVFAIGAASAQDITKQIKGAKKLVNAYKLNNDISKITEAKSIIETIFKNDAAKSNFDALIAKGDVYAALSSHDSAEKLKAEALGQTYEAQYVGMAVKALEAYKMALPLAEKGSQKKAVVSGYDNVDNALASEADAAFTSQDWDLGMKACEGILESSVFLEENGKTGIIADEETRDLWEYYAGLAASNTEQYDVARKHLSKLVKKGSTNGDVYKEMFNVAVAEGKEDEALGYLAKGREVDPENATLLFAEINYLIKKEEYGKLETLLKVAIEREPDNPSVYSTLGTVYNQLFKKSNDEGDKAKAKEYFDKALDYYNQALGVDSEFFNAIYSIGELYYNSAAAVITDLQALESDYSKEGLKKYEAKKEEMMTFFDSALPYFKRAEKLDPNDRNTMIAMKEIFARKGDIETSNQIKERIDKLTAGEKFEKPFFN
ncbi:MAG: tetratricopeptide repeat protein [Bacteroidia bacterium]|nr:tetratricopeptide repeat protein [Bacteroidia bacterium]